ncbi:MAG: hypothetical protein GF404_11570 [candidate division Zixibacteria bacterium]|jgi:hypothetical protein|nr:hypothetical protein [candidate division Zixibacteria bacterium]
MKIKTTLLILLALTALATAQAFDEENKLSIFEIMQPDGYFGTAFAIEDSVLGKVLLTCKHVLQDSTGEYFDFVFMRKNRLRTTRQVVSDTSVHTLHLKDKREKLFIEHPDKNIDLVAILLDQPHKTLRRIEPIIAFDGNLIMDKRALTYIGIDEGTEVEIVGFSLTTMIPFDNINYHTSRFGKIALYTTDDYSLSIDGERKTANFLLLDVSIRPGDSGAPIIANIGQRSFFIGVVAALMPDTEFGIGYPSYYIYDFLMSIRKQQNNRSLQSHRKN